MRLQVCDLCNIWDAKVKENHCFGDNSCQGAPGLHPAQGLTSFSMSSHSVAYGKILGLPP